ncbi:MAG: hypothetical protein AB1648_05025 [Pseudomonadota bacterium]|jgi:hypothetical protein
MTAKLPQGGLIQAMNDEALRGQASRIAHNVREHIEMLLELLGDTAISPEVKQRLFGHIAEEERGNIEKMNDLLADYPAPWPREYVVVRDHSQFLIDVIGGALPPSLSLKLLHHLLEEHKEMLALGREEEAPLPAPSVGQGPMGPVLRLTLGSLRTKGRNE